MRMTKIQQGQEVLVEYERDNIGHMDKMFRQMYQKGNYIDAYLASKYEPHLVIKGHRVILASASKFLHQKFKRSSNVKDVILIEAVEHKYLNYFVKLLYEGKVQLPSDEMEAFKATLRALNVRLDNKLGQIIQDSDDEIMDLEESKTNVVTSSSSSTVQLDASFSPMGVPSEMHFEDTKIDLKPNKAKTSPTDFVQKVTQGNKNLLIQEFSDSSTCGSPSSSAASVVAPPPTKISRLSEPSKVQNKVFKRSTPCQGYLGLFWIEATNEKNLKKEQIQDLNDASKKAKKVFLAKNSTKFYLGFETSKIAKDFMDTFALLNPSLNPPKAIEKLPLNEIETSDFQETAPEKRIHICNIPADWNTQGLLRLFKKHKIILENPKDLDHDVDRQQALLKIKNLSQIDKIVKVIESAKMTAQVL